MSISSRMVRTTALAGGALGLLALSACATPGSSGSGGEASPDGTSSSTNEITAPVTTEQVAELGDITLSVWADQGEQDLMDAFIPVYEKKFPNVTVDVQYKSYNDLVATVLNAMNSDDAPDVTQGNQGWATDGALVKAGLIRPLDDVAKAYGYVEAAGDATSQVMWSADGNEFGTGNLYGMSPDNQMVGIFYNKEKLAELGLDVPRSLADFEAALKAAGDGSLMLGNSDKASAMQTLSVIQGALTPATDTRAWITGTEGTSFDVETNTQAVDTFTGWVDSGYVNSGYNGMSPDDAAANFAAGDGLFFVGGNWNAGTITDGDKFGFVSGFDEGGNASSGSFGMPWHVSTKSDAEPAAAAFVGMLNSAETAQLLAQVNRVPIHPVEAPEDNSMLADLLVASKEQLQSNGALYWFDWATDTMFDTFTSGLQQALEGRISGADLTAQVQADWDQFHTK